MTSRERPAVTWMAWLLVLAGIAAVLFATSQWGPVVSWDSLVYLRFAEDPSSADPTIALFGPVFPLALWGLGKLGMPLSQAARALDGLVFGLTIALSVGIARRYARDPAAPLLAAALVLTSRVLFEQSVRVMSDSLGLLLGFTGLFLVAEYLDRGSFPRLCAAGLLIGLAMATRYACAPFLVTCILLLLFGRAAPPRRAVSEAALLAILASVPLALWLLRNRAVAGTSLNRKFTFHAPSPGVGKDALLELSKWILPLRFPAGVRFAALTLAAAAVAWLAWSVRGTPRAALRSRFGMLLGRFIPVYAVFMLFVTFFVDASVAVGNRHWLPVYFSALLLLLLLLDDALQRPGHWPGSRMLRPALVVVLVFFAGLTGARAVLLHRDGADYSGRKMQESVLRVLQHDSARAVYSDDPQAVAYRLGVPVKRLPSKFAPQTREPSPEYPGEMRALEDQLRSGRAVTVRFFESYDRYPTVEELETRLSIPLIARDEICRIYGFSQPAR